MDKSLHPGEIRRRALRAAAAAAGLSLASVSLVSCSDAATSTSASGDGQAVDSDGAIDAADTAASDTAASDASAEDASGDDAASTDVAVADSAGGDTTSADTTSADTASADTASADIAPIDDVDTTGCPDPDPKAPDCTKLAPSDANWATCCQDRLAYCQQAHADVDAQNACQFGSDFSGQCTGCIPWGPPAPPAFDPSWRPQVRGNGAVFEVV